MVKVVAFYTANTPYQEEIVGLERTCKKFGLPLHKQGYANRLVWVKNAGIKPEFLLEMINRYPGEKLVYLDADARVKKQPVLFETLDCDLALYYRHDRELLSGTIFFVANDRVRRLFQEWANNQKRNPETWDQRILARVLRCWRGELKLGKLPASYCQIFDTMRHHGKPVIEHMQASRRFKRLVEHCPTEGYVQVPSVIGKSRIRLNINDGSHWIPRADKVAEAFMDKHCIRVGRTLRWVPKFSTGNKIESLKPLFDGQGCYIIGKGPSLDDLTYEYFTQPQWPIIALNETILIIERMGLPNPVFGLQQDASLRNKCQPQRSPIFVETKAANYYRSYKDAYLFENTRIGLHRSALSVSAAIKIARSLGVSSFELLCFDSCVNKKLTYAKCIGYAVTWGGKPGRFLTHKKKIVHSAADIPIVWTIPEAPA